MNHFTVSLQSLSLCSPFTGNIATIEDIKAAEWSNLPENVSWEPDMAFLPKMAFRRLSRLSKMSLYVAHYASAACSAYRIGAPIFCSRYGELQHTYEVLKAIQSGELVSPMNFSYSVHNTGQGLFSILHKDTRPATVLSARHDILEHALCKAYAQLQNGDEAALIVYADDVMPAPFRTLPDSDVAPLAFAIVVTQDYAPDGFGKVSLSYAASSKAMAEPYIRAADQFSNSNEYNIAKALFSRKPMHYTNDTGRLCWNWCAHEA